MDFPFAPLHQGMVRRKVHGLAMAQRTVAVTPERGRLLLVLERREVVGLSASGFLAGYTACGAP